MFRPIYQLGSAGARWCWRCLFIAVSMGACGGTSPEVPPTQRLVDLFPLDGTTVVGSPELAAAPRARWAFGESSDMALMGWSAQRSVTGLGLEEGRLVGTVSGDDAVLSVEWDDPVGANDLLWSVEVDLRVSAGANLHLELLGPDADPTTLPQEDWTFRTPLVPGDDSRTYRLTTDEDIEAADIRHVFLRPADESDAEFSIASIRLLFRREYLAETPSGVGWHGLSEVYQESLLTKAPETVSIPLTLPPKPWLDLSIGTMDEGRVTFRVEVRPEGGTATPVFTRTVTSPHLWQAVPVELDQFAGETVELALSVQSDHEGAVGLWGAPAIRSHDAQPPGQPSALAANPPQGVLLIMADTIRPDHLSAYGYKRETTPTLNRLVSEGTLFQDAISQATWTKVSTPSILTSLYPASHTVKDIPDRLPSSALTLAEIFRDAGYATLSFSSVTFTGQSTNLHQGFETVHEGESRTGEKQSKSARQYVDRLAPWLVRHHDVPFFVFLHVFDPHSPFEPRAPYDTMWADPDLRDRHMSQVAAVREHIASDFMKRVGMPTRAELESAEVDPEEFISYWHDWYDGSIRGMDTEIGRVIELLDEHGLTDRTLVAFIGDHGEEFLEHGSTWHGGTVYGELTNVPLVLRHPGVIPRGHTVDTTVRSIDLMPTILELSGLPIPDAAQGQSLLPLVNTDDDAAVGEWVVRAAVSEEHARETALDVTDDLHESYALVLDGWRLIHNAQVAPDDTDPEFELYNHETDPLGLHDVADDHPDIVERLSAELERWRRRTEAARLTSDEELSSTLDADELERLRSLGYLR